MDPLADMNPSALILGATVLGLVVNTIGIFLLVWRGGRLIGRMEGNQEKFTEELDRLGRIFDALEVRVGRLEGRA